MSLPRLALQSLAFSVQEFYGPERYDLDAPYQRGAVWSLEQKRNLIKSLLMGLPVGVIFANYVRFDPERPRLSSRIVDGKQRITAIREFVEGNVDVPAVWFEERDLAGPTPPLDSEGEWVCYSDLSEIGKRKFDSSSLSCYQSRLTTIRAEAELYLLINFGGVGQTEEDRERAKGLVR